MQTLNLRRLKAELLRHEGLRLKPYLCPAGKLTVGVGRNLEDRGLSEEEADYLLENDLQYCADALATQLPWTVQLPLEVREVLINMTFNLGITGLLGFKKTLESLQRRDWKAAAQEMLDSRWATQVGPRAEELAQKIVQVELGQRQSLEILMEIKQQIQWIEKQMEGTC
ncbi:MAG: glycoside hydrolase family protein [bacterium]|nr:glycoside hydrolase family protein [bacterium]